MCRCHSLALLMLFVPGTGCVGLLVSGDFRYRSSQGWSLHTYDPVVVVVGASEIVGGISLLASDDEQYHNGGLVFLGMGLVDVLVGVTRYNRATRQATHRSLVPASDCGASPPRTMVVLTPTSMQMAFRF
jgi:hypothetical protein